MSSDAAGSDAARTEMKVIYLYGAGDFNGDKARRDIATLRSKDIDVNGI